MNHSKQPTPPPPAYTATPNSNASYSPHPNHTQATYIAYPTAPMPSYPQGANSQTHQPIPPYVSPNGIYYTPPPPGAYPGSNTHGYTQAYVPGQTIIIKDNNRYNDAAEDSLCACLMGALLCCCCLEMFH